MNHENYMARAVKEAREGIAQGQSPFGAVVVKEGLVIASAHNQVWASTDPTAHAEVLALRVAAKALKTPHLYPVDAFYVHYTIEAIIIVVLGGAGTLSGPILGAIVYSLAKYYLSVYLPGFQLLLFSPLLIAAVVLFPGGIVGNMKRCVAGTWLEDWVL